MVRYSLKKVVNKLFDKQLYWFQLRFLHDCMNKQRVVGAFCRQTGKSMTIAILTIIEALKNPNGHIVIVAPTDRQAGELFNKITAFIKGSNIGTEVESYTNRQMVMKNGCRVSAFPCGDHGDTIRGMTANVLIMEEASYIKDSIVNQVLLPMVAATDGKVIKISTPFGMNHFYKSFNDDDNYLSHKYTWEDAVGVGHFNQEFIDEQRKQCNKLEFRTEYEAEFIADEDSYFGYELVRDCIHDVPTLTSPVAGKVYYLGSDIARMGEDSSVFTIVEQGDPHKVVSIIEINKSKLDGIVDYILGLHDKWRFAKIYIDETGLGAGVTDMIAKKLNRTKLNQNPKSFSSSNYPTDVVVGVTFTIKNKLDIFSNAKVLMEHRKIIIPDNTKLIFQLQDFRYEITESGNVKLHHSEGGHDDYCDSFALACRGLTAQPEVLFDFG